MGRGGRPSSRGDDGRFDPDDKPLRHPLIDEVASALVGMGWRPAEADQAVVDMPVPPDATIEQLLRQALRSMPR